MPSMTVRRWVLAATAVAVAVLAVVFVVLGWERADKVASLASALAGVAAVGVALWAAWPMASGGGGLRVLNTGRATVRGDGRANTGFSGRADALPSQVRVEQTGNADAGSGGNANSGVELT
ncbi:hypothetical protein Aple_021880 [Acrocarpospora pleiomorpha]|uniref:Uncharacterized protein n=1 Tax=Acrocarpospora pleiomorpha TaxID=90975 RepID=A0A5M3XEW4_9ACTN|nr:hypothetical protein Aple_021880 [Acrocarpospora pleiomorpha]